MSLCSCCYVAKSVLLHVHTTNITAFVRRDNVLFMSFVTMSLCRQCEPGSSLASTGKIETAGLSNRTPALFFKKNAAYFSLKIHIAIISLEREKKQNKETKKRKLRPTWRGMDQVWCLFVCRCGEVIVK